MTSRCALPLLVLLALVGCATAHDADPDAGSDASVDATDTTETADAGATATHTPPVADPEAAARAFRLYYRERVERAVVAYQRFMLVGDTGFGVTIGRVGVAREGADLEIVPGPNDNNLIGTSTWTTWQAYRLFRTRTLALALVRAFDGLAFLEAVSGHPGVTSRMVYPGWTRVVDGPAGTVARTRAGVPVSAPGDPLPPALEAELLATFWGDVRVTYREEPPDFLFEYYPAAHPAPYAVTHSFSALPAFLRVSDCCTSLMQTPAEYPWAGAFWGNHNSRDNLPDLSFGFVAAMEAAADPDADPEVRAAAERAVAAGQRIGDLIWDSGGAVMTVDEHNPYDTLVVSGAVRPDGETEIEDLGSMGDCPMAYLTRAIATDGLAEPLPSLPIPGTIERILVDEFGPAAECPVPEGVRHCERLEEAFCGLDWAEMEDLRIFGEPWLDTLERAEEATPGTAEQLIGSFQDDYFEMTQAMVGIVEVARVTGQPELHARASVVLAAMTKLMRRFADIIYTRTKPEQLARRRYEAALFDGWGGLDVLDADLGDLALAEQRIASIESLLALADTEPHPLMTDEAIATAIEANLAGRSETVKARYAEAYGDSPPIRRTEAGYEARGVPEAEHPWHAVEVPRHVQVGGLWPLDALPLCHTAPGILDCAWAIAGCARADFDGDGEVGAADQAAFEAARDANTNAACDEENEWCAGADLDRTGAVDATDEAFLAAAVGCWYEP